MKIKKINFIKVKGGKKEKEKIIRRFKILWDISFMIFFEVFLLAIVATVFMNKYLSYSSIRVYDFKYTADWIFLAITILCLIMAIYYLYVSVKISKPSLKKYIYQNAGYITITSILFFLINEWLLPPNKGSLKIILSNIKAVPMHYYITFFYIGIVAVLSLILNRKFLKLNNWYIFWSIAPYIVWGGATYKKYLSWMNFISSGNFSYHTLAKMFLTYQNTKQAHFDLALIYEYSLIPEYFYLGIFLLSIFIGGGIFVFREKEKIEKRIKKRHPEKTKK